MLLFFQSHLLIQSSSKIWRTGLKHRNEITANQLSTCARNPCTARRKDFLTCAVFASSLSVWKIHPYTRFNVCFGPCISLTKSSENVSILLMWSNWSPWLNRRKKVDYELEDNCLFDSVLYSSTNDTVFLLDSVECSTCADSNVSCADLNPSFKCNWWEQRWNDTVFLLDSVECSTFNMIKNYLLHDFLSDDYWRIEGSPRRCSSKIIK